MNKSQGLFAGTFLAAAFLFRMGGGLPTEGRISSLSPTETDSGLTQLTPGRKDLPGDGPWLASCRYWSPSKSRSATQAPDSGRGSPQVRPALQTDNANIEVNQGSREQQDDSGCGSDAIERWGIPHGGSPEADSPQITTIVAIVPDPVHTHLSLGFDRTVQALLEAAADNGYLSSYYWLPWSPSHGSSRSEGSFSNEHDPNLTREHQPGLIVLKHNADPLGDVSLASSYYKVIYVFLVAETPTEGIDGSQLQNALLYRSQIQKIADGDGKNSSGSWNATMIGPTYSGSAASLRIAIETACPIGQPQCPKEFAVYGATETLLSVKVLMSAGKNGPSRVNYYSFAAHISCNMEEFLKQAVASGYDPAKIAVLSEDDTVFGSNGLGYHGRMDVARKPDAGKQTDTQLDPNKKILYMHFPREISLLRNTGVDSDPLPASSGNPPSPYLHFSMKDPNGQDSVVQFSREHTPLSQESQLMAIARELKGRRIKVVAISASDPLDEIFLARFFRRTSPDARLVFVQSDLLMARDVDVIPYVGSITISPYSFMTKLFRAPGVGGARVYTDTGSEAYYNAASFAFWRQRSLENPAPQSSHNTAAKETVPLEGYRPDEGKTYLRPPALWVTTLGSDGYYPIGVVHPCPNDSTDSGPEFRRLLPQIRFDDQHRPVALDQSCDLSQANSPPKPSVKRASLPGTHPALQWEALCAIVAILCLFHAVLINSAKYNSSLTHDLDVRNNDQPHRRSVYIRFSTAMLVSMAFVLAIPLLVLELIVPFNGISLAEAAITLLSSLFALRAGFSVTGGFSGWRKVEPAQATSPLELRWANFLRDRCSANVYSVFNAMAGVTTILIPAVWTYICLSNTHHGTALRSLKYADVAGLCFAFRCIHPLSGVSPVLPVLLLLFGWYLWGLFQTWRMCFSDSKRPRLPKTLNGGYDSPLFVSDWGGPLG